MPSSPPTVKDIKASFEALTPPSLPPQSYRPRNDLANRNMLPKKFSNPLKNSIDSVISQTKGNQQPGGQAPATPSAPSTPSAPPAISAPSESAPSAPATSPTNSTLPSSDPATTARPTTSQRPSWIGPPRASRSVTPGVSVMKQAVTIEHASPGLQPPVYIFTSLSDPQWDAVEMEHEKMANGENRFFKTFQAEEGDYQYKFRLGPGDWWALDESKPMVDDGSGNKNNLLVVKPPDASKSAETPTIAAPVEQQKGADHIIPQSNASQPPATEHKPDNTTSSPSKSVEQTPSPSSSAPSVLADSQKVVGNTLEDGATTAQKLSTMPPNSAAAQSAAAPLAPHESPVQPAASGDLLETTKATPPQTATVTSRNDTKTASTTEAVSTPVQAPLMDHENFEDASSGAERTQKASRPIEDEDDEEDDEDDDDDDDTEDEDGDSDEEDREANRSPLLRHESFEPGFVEELQAPRLRHESTNIGEHGDDEVLAPLSPSLSIRSRSRSSPRYTSARDAVAPEADANDPSLEKFPTTHQAILDHIHNTTISLPEDETRDDFDLGGLKSASSGVPSVASLPSVQEDEDEELEVLREQERIAAEREIAAEEVDPNDDTSSDEQEDESLDGPPVLMITEADESRPAAPITPPLTPKDMEMIIEEEIREELAIEEAEENAEQEVLTEAIFEARQDVAREQRQADASGLETVRKQSVISSFMDALMHPMSLIAIAGLAVAVAAGVWKLRDA